MKQLIILIGFTFIYEVIASYGSCGSGNSKQVTSVSQCSGCCLATILSKYFKTSYCLQVFESRYSSINTLFTSVNNDLTITVQCSGSTSEVQQNVILNGNIQLLSNITYPVEFNPGARFLASSNSTVVTYSTQNTTTSTNTTTTQSNTTNSTNTTNTTNTTSSNNATLTLSINELNTKYYPTTSQVVNILNTSTTNTRTKSSYTSTKRIINVRPDSLNSLPPLTNPKSKTLTNSNPQYTVCPTGSSLITCYLTKGCCYINRSLNGNIMYTSCIYTGMSMIADYYYDTSSYTSHIQCSN